MAIRRRRLYRAATAAVAIPGAAFGTLAALPLTPAQAQAPGVDLKVLSPRAGDALGTSAFSLDVAFRSRSKSPVTTAELWVDGVRWVRQDLPEPQVANRLQFAVDASTLAEGAHDVVVKVFTASGAASQTRLTIQAGDGQGALETRGGGGPEMRFANALNGRRVSGSVELLLDAPAKNGTNPYITIYVDKQFKTLKNYPPYSYVWDTTQVPNGFHTIEATGYLESTTASTTRRIQVYVDNAGGNTTIKNDVADLSAPDAASAASTAATRPDGGALVKRVVAVNGTGAAKRVAAKPAAAVKRVAAVIPAVTLKPEGEPVVSAAATTAAVEVRPLDLAETAAPASPAAVPETLVMPYAADAPAAKPAANKAVKAIRNASASRRVVAQDKVKLAAVAPVAASPLAAPVAPVAAYVAPALNGSVVSAERAVSAAEAVAPAPLASVAAPTLTIKPAAPMLMAPQIKALAAAVKPAAARTVATAAAPKSTAGSVIRAAAPAKVASAGGPRVAVKPTARGLIQVAYDGRQIAFDVPPRVDAGMPIAPFRHIFEHTGGKVEWHAPSRVVRAINADREVVINVGTNQAVVNGRGVSMERAATIEKGRTLVPLSFVGQALDVTVKYDPATGHLDITSK